MKDTMKPDTLNDLPGQSALLATHTAEPWTCCVHDDPVWRFGPNAEKLNIVGLTSQKNDEANASRIVACVNALAGIHDPALALREVREALDRIASWNEGEVVTPSFDEPHSAIIARAALALLGKATP